VRTGFTCPARKVAPWSPTDRCEGRSGSTWEDPGFHFGARSGTLPLAKYGLMASSDVVRLTTHEVMAMAKGQQKPKTNNKPKLSAKERKQKKKEKVKARTA
jgi:hypothetical protein